MEKTKLVLGPLLWGSVSVGRRLELPAAKSPAVCPPPNVLGTYVEVMHGMSYVGLRTLVALMLFTKYSSSLLWTSAGQ